MRGVEGAGDGWDSKLQATQHARYGWAKLNYEHLGWRTNKTLPAIADPGCTEIYVKIMQIMPINAKTIIPTAALGNLLLVVN